LGGGVGVGVGERGVIGVEAFGMDADRALGDVCNTEGYACQGALFLMERYILLL